MLDEKVIISDLVSLEVTGMLQLVGDTAGIALYMARTGEGSSKISQANGMPYETTLSPASNRKIDGFTLDAAPSWPTIIIPQWLPTAPDWTVTVADDNSTAAAVLAFGGAYNALLIGAANEGTLDIPNILEDEDYSNPRFLRGAVPASAATAYTSAVANGKTLMLFPPASIKQPAKGIKLVPALSGVVFQDASSDSALWVVYRQGGKQSAILSSTGAVLGSVKLSSFDESLKTAGHAVSIIDDPVITEFDVDIRDGVYFLLAATDAEPQLILFDNNGATTKLDWPSNGLAEGNWMSSPTVLAVPAVSPPNGVYMNAQGQTPEFLFAFIEMSNKGPVGIRLGAVMVPLATDSASSAA
ncbi:MAG: hypothetical protein WAW41_03755 [Methylobacter sp.]